MKRKIATIWICMAMVFGFVVIVDVITDFTPTVRTTTLYVNTTGDNGGYTSIQDAINASHDGDTVFVYNGTYYENVVVNKTINLMGEDKDLTVIDGGDIGDVIRVVADWVNISGFTVTGSGNSQYNSGISISPSATSLNYDHPPTLTPSSYVPRQLTFANNYEGGPAFHPDGRKIAYEFYEGGSPKTNIWVMDIDGTNKTRLTAEPKFEQSPHYSPDGKKIAYTSYLAGGGDWQIHTMDSDGSNKTQLTTESRRYYSPIYHPTNTKIYYVDGDVDDIFYMDQDGTNVTRVTNFGDASGQSICFSPDGNYLLYPTYHSNLWRVDLESLDRVAIGGPGFYGPEYSKDGTKIAYFVNTGSPRTPYIMDSDGTNNTYLQTQYYVSAYSTINGQWDIAFDSEQDGGDYRDIWILDKRPFVSSIKISERSGQLTIEIHFNEQMNKSSVENAFVVKNKVTDELVNGTFRWNAYRDVLIFQSRNMLDYVTEYIANLTYNCTDDNDNMLERNYSWVFQLPFTPYIHESHCSISNCNVEFNGGFGVLINWSMNNTIFENTIHSNDFYGIYINHSLSNKVHGNNISNNSYGIFLKNGANSNKITENNISLNKIHGLEMDYSLGNILMGNNVSKNNYTGIFLLVSHKNAVIDNNASSNNGAGIYLHGSNSNDIDSNQAINNSVGIYLIALSRYNDLSRNNISSNSERGVFLDWCESNNIINNRILLNNLTGICLIQNSDGNNILENNISKNLYGIELLSSSGNKIYHNDFVNNTNQASEPSMSVNNWDDGYPSGGNYWSDYSGIDIYKGPNQDIPGSDHIGDSNFTIDSDSIDRYPLMQPYKPLEDYIILYEGWNLISIPMIQIEQNLTRVLGSIDGLYDAVQWYDITDTNDHWKHNRVGKPFGNDLFELNETRGFWIHITQPGATIFIYNGTQLISNQTIILHPGWNMVGYPSLSSKNRTAALNNLTFGTHVDAVWTYNTV
ncbi:MAG: right-handed parallel beta-helix repeat-containing protein, partial [Thermoplasmata archaeon]